MIKRIRIYPKRSLEDGAFEASVNFLDKEGQLVDVDDEGGGSVDLESALPPLLADKGSDISKALYAAFGPSMETVTITDGTEVTEFGTLNKWTVTAPVTLTLPEVVEGAGHLVHVDFLDRITWPAGTEVHGDTEGLTEAWLSLVGDDGHWTVLVSSSGDGLITEHVEAEDPHPQYIRPVDGNIFIQTPPAPGESGSFYAGPTGFGGDSTGVYDHGDRIEENSSFWSLDSAGSSYATTETTTRWPNGDVEEVKRTSIASPPTFALTIQTTHPDGSDDLVYRSLDLGYEGISNVMLPDTEMTPETLATQEWVQSQTPLPKSVAAVADLAGHTSVEDGHSTLVVALGKPVWSLGSTFVDAIGTQVWPT